MRFLISNKFREDVIAWLRTTYGPDGFSRWFPFFLMPMGAGPAIMAKIDEDDCVAFSLTFECVEYKA